MMNYIGSYDESNYRMISLIGVRPGSNSYSSGCSIAYATHVDLPNSPYI